MFEKIAIYDKINQWWTHKFDICILSMPFSQMSRMICALLIHESLVNIIHPRRESKINSESMIRFLVHRCSSNKTIHKNETLIKRLKNFEDFPISKKKNMNLSSKIDWTILPFTLLMFSLALNYRNVYTRTLISNFLLDGCRIQIKFIFTLTQWDIESMLLLVLCHCTKFNLSIYHLGLDFLYRHTWFRVNKFSVSIYIIELKYKIITFGHLFFCVILVAILICSTRNPNRKIAIIP